MRPHPRTPTLLIAISVVPPLCLLMRGRAARRDPSRWGGGAYCPFDCRAIYPVGSAAGKGATVRTAAGFRSDAFGATQHNGGIDCRLLLGARRVDRRRARCGRTRTRSGEAEEAREAGASSGAPPPERDAEAPERDPDLHR